MLAGGTGLAPILAMLEVLADQGHAINPSISSAASTMMTILSKSSGSNRSSWPAADLHRGDVRCQPGQRTSPERLSLSTPGGRTPQRRRDCDVYLRGPPPMVEAVRAFFVEKRVSPSHFLL